MTAQRHSDADRQARLDAGAEAAAWAARAPHVARRWFAYPSELHGVSHTRRVHIHAQRLTRELAWAELDARLALTAALWHDIGRTHDGEDPGHGGVSALRAVRFGLTDALAPADADVVLFAVTFHCLPDELGEREAPHWHEEARPGDSRRAEPERNLRILRLLKDADALDRVRLGPWEAADPRQLRHPQTARQLPFAAELFHALP